ncbi:MAG: hypothetical protein GX589_04805 [Deltaproteobacteria bacterium]|nr:hypothetical protein [Deltaproteobacteria bacterium]
MRSGLAGGVSAGSSAPRAGEGLALRVGWAAGRQGLRRRESVELRVGRVFGAA